jgi:hypothetical protein
MFSATIQTEALQHLLDGEIVMMNHMAPGCSGQDDTTAFVDVQIHQVPVDGTHWMFLNGEKHLVRVTSEASDDDECPCCTWCSVFFKIVG